MEPSALWIMGLPWGSWEEGRAQRRMSYLGEQEAKKLDRKWVWETEVYLGLPEGWVFSQGDSERDPASNFPLPFPELVEGLRRPLVYWSSVVCHPFKCSHFQVTILSLALPWAEHVWHTGLTFTP